MLLADYPPCEVDDTHVATIHCPDCEENFCIDCDLLIHGRKKNKDHVREAIEIQSAASEAAEAEPEVEAEPEAADEPPVPCDSDATHEAVMYCEDCEENFCAECDYTFHSRKKTANHMRFEGARRPEVAAALKAEIQAEEEARLAAEAAAQEELTRAEIARAEELAAAEEAAHLAAEQAEAEAEAAAEAAQAEATRAAEVAAAAAAQAAALRAKLGKAPLAVSKPGVAGKSPVASPATAAGVKTAATAAAGKSTAASAVPHQPSAAAAAALKKAAAAKRNTASSAYVEPGDDSSVPSSDDRVAEHKAAWNELRQTYCKKSYNVGHWLGLMTEDRKELAITLCKELLFNPQPSETPEASITVDWNTVSYWTTYEIDVECEKNVIVNGVKKKTTLYKVHIDDMGRLQEFEIITDGVSQSGCSIM